ncbi:MAG: polysaccharide biosynthesis tyrosine autokinase [Beijerinckiaceae bacterium]|nr:polysaccharide biosynthesis tyrosine autokinase [Beijerinckiaceae bacterium]
MNLATSPRTGFDGYVASLGGQGGIAAPLWRRRGLAAAVLSGVLGLTVAALVVIPTRYLASATVIVAEPDPNAPAASGAQAEKSGDPADLESQLLIIHSPRILRMAMAMPGFREAVAQEHGGGFESAFRASSDQSGRSAESDDALLDYVQTHYAVSSVGRSRVINISYQSPIPSVAKTLANDLATAFLADQRDAASKSRGDAAASIWAEVKRLEASLRDDEAKIQEFRRSKGLVRGTAAPISSERLTAISQQLLMAQAARADAAAQLGEIKANGGKNASEAPAVLASRTVADIKQQLTVVIGQIASSSSTLGANHPALRALEHQRDDLQRHLDQEVAAVAVGLRKTYNASDVRVAALQKELETAKSEAGAATDDEATIGDLVRAADIKRGQFETLYKQANELDTQRSVLVGSARLVSLAELPVTPFFPKRGPFLAAGLFIGLLAGAAAALLRDRFDAPPSPTENFSERTGLPVLAELPVLTAALQSRRGHHIRSVGGEPLCPIGVALRDAQISPALGSALDGLAAEIFRAQETQRMHSFLVISTSSGDGKTFTTLALAQHIAINGNSVLVIECDDRNPSFEVALQTDAAPGLAAVLRGAVRPSTAVMETSIRNLHAIPAGTPSSRSMESLFVEGLPKLLKWARKYDFVLLDGLPFDAGVEARVLSRYADGVLLCVREDKADAAETVRVATSLQSAGARLIGLAITMSAPTTMDQEDIWPAARSAYPRAS